MQYNIFIQTKTKYSQTYEQKKVQSKDFFRNTPKTDNGKCIYRVGKIFIAKFALMNVSKILRCQKPNIPIHSTLIFLVISQINIFISDQTLPIEPFPPLSFSTLKTFF